MQFTPDLMPGDVTGSLVYDARTAAFTFREGPVFTNLLLADEINRTPPKTQAALLEAMEERQVSVEGEPRRAARPVRRRATQNPVEYEGTYPLPEAQLDRFLLKLTVPLPSRDEEVEVLTRHARRLRPARPAPPPASARWPTAADLAAGRAAVAPGARGRPRCSATSSTWPGPPASRPRCSSASHRAGATALLATARAWAWLSGRDYVTPDDVKALARPALRHRRPAAPRGRARGRHRRRACSTRVLATVPVPR